MSTLTGKLLYGLLFCVVLPLLLLVWASAVPLTIPVPASGQGWAVALSGLLLMLLGMQNLWVYGKGLPMNAYPPSVFVNSGAYKYLAHPIYVGFTMLCLGISMSLNNSFGFYLVTPVVMLCCVALVKGYEEPELRKRFPKSAAPLEQTSSLLTERFLKTLPLWFGWLAGYELLIWLGHDQSFIDTVLAWERSVPVMEWTVIPYVMTYPFVILTPLVLRDRNMFSDYLKEGWYVILAGLFFQFLLPLYASPRFLAPTTWMGELILSERAYDGPAAALPSFHVLWVLFSARWLAKRFGMWPWILALLISVSCFTTGNHSVLDVVAAFGLYYVIVKRTALLHFLQAASERLANSWTEWRWGPFRIISHAWYSGLAGVTAGIILTQFTRHYVELDIIIISALIGGAAWGQWVEGSKSMLRPFGYYGAIMGGIVAMISISLLNGVPVIYWLAVFAMATPFTQAVGRLRCLVQGCCHGNISSGTGIRYFNEHTRVAHLPNMKGKLIHNTQGYSIFFNLIAGVMLLRLNYGGASTGILAGLYFIFTGTFRFVEEAYRGEPQTKIVMGLRFYQCMAIGSVALGCVLTVIPCDIRPEFKANFSWQMVVTSLVAGLVWAFGLSMDFPNSTSRYARLTG